MAFPMSQTSTSWCITRKNFTLFTPTVVSQVRTAVALEHDGSEFVALPVHNPRLHINVPSTKCWGHSHSSAARVNQRLVASTLDESVLPREVLRGVPIA